LLKCEWPGIAEMKSLPEEREFSQSVKSVTLEEYTNPPLPLENPSLILRALGYVKLGLMAWGIISFGALAGIASYYLKDDPARPILVSQVEDPAAASEAEQPVDPAQTEQSVAASAPELPIEPTDTAPAPIRLAALVEIPQPSIVTDPPSGLAQALALRVRQPGEEARLPRPRPEAPIITGSIGRPAHHSRRRNFFDPCAAIRSIGVPFLFGNRCAQHARVYAPAPRHASRPEPYSPPVIARN
jgi:hypothetical protein